MYYSPFGQVPNVRFNVATSLGHIVRFVDQQKAKEIEILLVKISQEDQDDEVKHRASLALHALHS
jgi:hypothetical protein